MAEPCPCAVIISTSEDIFPETIINGILETEFLPEAIDVLEGVTAYQWQISTKYYDASIRLCALDRKTLGNQEFAESVNAVIIYFDSQSDLALSKVEEWLPFTNEFDSEVKILVCNRCYETETFHHSNNPTTGLNRLTAATWCIKHGFELVELNPEIEEKDVEDDFPETVGVKRIAQALEAHIWPNMIPKGKLGIGSRKEDSPAELRQDEITKAIGLMPDEDSFESLFQNLSTMKSKANKLPSVERKDFAEKMAIAFWRAMGGDESEIEDLHTKSDDEDRDAV